MTDLTNFVKFHNDGTLSGNIATLNFDVDFTGQPNQSDNEKAPVFRLTAKTPRGRQVEIGAIFKNKNKEGGEYYSMGIRTGHGKLYANLGRYPGQDDDTLMAVIFRD